MCPSDVTAQLQAWKSDGLQGGWIWLYDDLQKCQESGACSAPMNTAAYAHAVLTGLGDTHAKHAST